MARKVIHIPGNWHGDQPIPAATKTGPLVTSGAVSGMNPDGSGVPDDLEEQAQWAFEHVRRILAEAGGTPEDIAHVNVFMKSRDARPALNAEWIKMFPDEESRPTRQVLENDKLPGKMQLQLVFTAYVE